MLIELPSKEVKELFEGDFTQTSGSQRKDDHHPHPPRASFSASIPTRQQRAPCTHTHSHTRTRAHERGRSTAAPRSSGQPRPVPCPDTGTARPPRCPARLNARGHGGKRPAAARSTPAIPSGRGSAPLSILPFPPPYLKGVRPARSEPPGHRAALRGAPRCRSGSSVPPRRFSRYGRGCGSRSGGPAPRAAPRASAGRKRSPYLRCAYMIRSVSGTVFTTFSTPLSTRRHQPLKLPWTLFSAPYPWRGWQHPQPVKSLCSACGKSGATRSAQAQPTGSGGGHGVSGITPLRGGGIACSQRHGSIRVGRGARVWRLLFNSDTFKNGVLIIP